MVAIILDKGSIVGVENSLNSVGPLETQPRQLHVKLQRSMHLHLAQHMGSPEQVDAHGAGRYIGRMWNHTCN